MFSSRTNWDLSPNHFFIRRRALEKSGIRLIDLSESNPTHCQFHYLEKGLLNAFSESGNLSYDPDPKGLLTARETICHYYKEHGVQAAVERISLISGTSEAYHFLFRLLLNPGERVLAPRPSYPLLHFLSDLNDVKLDFYSLRYEDSEWKLDISSLE